MSDREAAPIGVVGLGAMGLGLAKSLLDHSVDVIGFDLGETQCESATRVGVRIADGLAELARTCPVMILVLPNGPDVNAVVDQIIPNAAEGSLLIDCSTIAPTISIAVAAKARGAGLRFADAAMGGDAANAASSAILFMVGAAEADRSDLAAVLGPISREIIWCGDVGAGVTTKLVNNALALTIFLADVEALVLSKAAGLDIDTTLSVLSKTGASNVAMSTLGGQLLSRSLEPGFRADLALKDVGLAVDLARTFGIELSGFAATQERYTEAVVDGLGGRNAAAAGLMIEKSSGITLA